MGGEAESPRFSMAHATKLVPFRVNFIYVISVVFITLLVPSDDNRLLGGSGVAASPFIIAVQNSGIPGIPSLLNAGMICGVLAIAAEAVYLSSRIMRTMAHQKLIWEGLATVDSRGRPRLALIITSLVAVVLGYIQIAGEHSTQIICQLKRMLTNISWWFDSFELVDLNHQCLFLYQLDHHFLCQLAIPSRAESTE